MRGGDREGRGLFKLFAYGVAKYGCHVACGDVDGDGYDEIITGPGPGGVFGPHVRGWDYDADRVRTKNISFKAYGTTQYGVEIACGDVDGDGYEEILTGPGPGSYLGAHLRGWDTDGGKARLLPGMDFLAYPSPYGVNVSGGAVSDDGRSRVLTGPGPGPGNGAAVKVWVYRDGATAPEGSFFAFNEHYGVLPVLHTFRY